MLAERWGRRRTILTGLGGHAFLLLAARFLPNVYAIGAILFLGGIAWSLININSLPMIVDIAPDDRLLGTYTGLYYISGHAGRHRRARSSMAGSSMRRGRTTTRSFRWPRLYAPRHRLHVLRDGRGAAA